MTKWRIFVPLLAMAATAQAATDTRQIADHYAQLADPVPETREAALTWLKGLTPADMQALYDVVAAQPIRPAQEVALSTIALHVYVREMYQQLPQSNKAFMGVSLLMGPRVFINGDRFVPDDDPAQGVRIEGCMVGFVANRLLQVGDYLLSYSRDGKTIRFTDREQLIDLVKKIAPGTAITLHVMRVNHPIDVPLTLDSRPLFNAENEDLDAELFSQTQHDFESAAKNRFERLFGSLLRASPDYDKAG